MQFIIRNSVKEIKNMIKAFTISGDVEKKIVIVKLNIKTGLNSVTFEGSRTGTRVTFDAEILERGAVSVNAGDFLGALKTIEERPEITVIKDRLSIIEGDFSRDVCDVDDLFDTTPEDWTGAPVAEIPGPAFTEAVNAVIHCACDDISKYSMNGVSLDFTGYQDAQVVTVATDGRRLAWHTVVLKEAGKTFDGFSRFTINSKAAEFVAANIGTGSVKFTASGYKCRIEFGPYILEGCYISGDFPSWRRVVPEAGLVNEFTLAPEFLKETDRIAKTATDNYHKVIIMADENGLVMSTENARQKVKAVQDIVGSVRFAVNVNYIRQAVKAAGKKALRFMFTDNSGRPFLAQAAGENGAEVIMPMNLEN